MLSLLMAACTATFTACNSDESSLPTTGNQLQLSFGINAPQSRAIFTDTKLPDGKPVGVRLDGYADYANLVYTGSTSGSNQTWTSTTSVTLTDTKGTLYAYWPQNNAVSIDAIDVDMTAADQTDWLYATPVTDVNEDKSSVAVTMNHALANINITVNKGSYLGAGNITNITVQSDGIALGGTFNAAKATPAYESFEDEGKPLSRNVTTTAGGTATDIMVVPSGKSAAITFLLTIDGIQFSAKSDAVQLAMGNSYQYTLNLSDISTYMEISGFSVEAWTSTIGGTLELNKVGPLTGTIDLTRASDGVYAVAQNGKGVAAVDADKSCIAVALVMGEHKFMILKNDAEDNTNTTWYWGKNLFGKDVADMNNYMNSNGSDNNGYLPKPDGTYYSTPNLSADFSTWKNGALSDFNGKENTRNINAAYNKQNVSMISQDVCSVLNALNAATDGSNAGKNDWYVPACGQLALMYLNINEINAALNNIGGAVLNEPAYMSSTEYDYNMIWIISFQNGFVGCQIGKSYALPVRFIRDI